MYKTIKTTLYIFISPHLCCLLHVFCIKSVRAHSNGPFCCSLQFFLVNYSSLKSNIVKTCTVHCCMAYNFFKAFYRYHKVILVFLMLWKHDLSCKNSFSLKLFFLCFNLSMWINVLNHVIFSFAYCFLKEKMTVNWNNPGTSNKKQERWFVSGMSINQ